MTDNQKIHHRRSLRLREYDYTQVGAYFVTIVLQDRLCLFGEIVNAEMQLSEAGKTARRIWERLPDRFPVITIDTFVIMPNHLHGIVIINQPNVGAPLVGAQSVGPQPALGDIIGAYKSLTTVEYTRGVKIMKWTPFHRRLWQRNYYEHVIRNENALGHIRQYIIDNPAQWDFDKENPLVGKSDSMSP